MTAFLSFSGSTVMCVFRWRALALGAQPGAPTRICLLLCRRSLQRSREPCDDPLASNWTYRLAALIVRAMVKANAAIHSNFATAFRVSAVVPAFRCSAISWSSCWISLMPSFTLAVNSQKSCQYRVHIRLHGISRAVRGSTIRGPDAMQSGAQSPFACRPFGLVSATLVARHVHHRG